MKEVVKNTKAFFHYVIEETFDAGIVLVGTEIKSLRQGGGNLQDAYAVVRREEVWLCHASILPYAMGNIHNHSPKRDRKLLLKKKEIRQCKLACERKGLTLIPLGIYLSNGLAKVRLAVAKGKSHLDKRQAIRKREDDRAMQRVVCRRNR
ncbi:SsrA-binding protein SmpB [Candidatus Similichlamydia laticola]|uniref:SsrA-binding protein n=1 Tax=Candidatus Similichlamydia laticola TaxID=2170265 RepID=A0A369KIJ8_9BACT|nr:SsrA-binding protein SmpB [Candidatus Similichlamydia laticola]RDB31594.1 tmRNA-binding protein SmpB [Candidatus Similichlamydia laticola]